MTVIKKVFVNNLISLAIMPCLQISQLKPYTYQTEYFKEFFLKLWSFGWKRETVVYLLSLLSIDPKLIKTIKSSLLTSPYKSGFWILSIHDLNNFQRSWNNHSLKFVPQEYNDFQILNGMKTFGSASGLGFNLCPKCGQLHLKQ